jgi:outer membrane PBP1 activator LpoA protein
MQHIRKTLSCVIGLSFLALINSCSMNNNASVYDTGSTTSSTTGVPKQIALLLPLTGAMAGPGQAVRDGFMSSYYQAVQSNQINTKVRIYNTAQTANIESLYEKAISEGADCVVGPLEKEKVQSLARSPAPITTIALNYLNPSSQGSANFYQFGLSPLDEAAQVAQYAHQQGYKSALIIAPAGPWGYGVVQAFNAQWKQLGGKVGAQFFYMPNQDLSAYIHQVLKVNDKADGEVKLARQPISSVVGYGKQAEPQSYHRQDVDMIFLVAQAAKARQINPLLKFYYAGDLPVYSISLVYSGIPSPTADQDLNGIVFDDMPWVFNPMAAKSSRFPRLYALGKDAFTVVMKRGQWRSSPGSTISGYTGVLSLNPGNRISRQLVWGRFEQGEVHQID